MTSIGPPPFSNDKRGGEEEGEGRGGGGGEGEGRREGRREVRGRWEGGRREVGGSWEGGGREVGGGRSREENSIERTKYLKGVFHVGLN